MGSDEILCRYVPKFKCGQILAKAHGGVDGGHYAGHTTAQKILCTHGTDVVLTSCEEF